MPFWLALLLFFFSPSYLKAQYPLPKPILFTADNPYGKVKSGKVFTLSYGHPTLGNFFDLAPPQKVYLKTSNESLKLHFLRAELFDPWQNKPRIAYSIPLELAEPGDYILCVETKSLMEPREVIRKHLTKTILHLQREKGWDSSCDFELEIKSYTRPYGFTPGSILWGQVLYKEEPVTEGTVTVERLQMKPLKEFSTNSTQGTPLNTRYKTTKLKEDGTFVVNFEEEGWWVVSFGLRRGVMAYGNKDYPFELYTHLWVYVFPKLEPKRAYKSKKTKTKPIKGPRKTKD